MKSITIKINDIEIETREGITVLQAAYEANLYIPCLCFHPDFTTHGDLKPNDRVYRGEECIENDNSKKAYENCGLCIGTLKGVEGYVSLSNLYVSDGMVVYTNTDEINRIRKNNLGSILSHHPHACLTCAQRDGCSLTECSSDVPVNERCCYKFNRCELRRIAEYIGIREDIPRYLPKNYPVLRDEPLFSFDFNLCIGCLRCIRICKDVRGVGALGYVYNDKKIMVGLIENTLEKSGCKFCGSCVDVCPTGALGDKDVIISDEMNLVPCKFSCPVEMDAPRYVNYIAERRFEDALRVIEEKAPFPGVLGYVCHHPCESKCRRNNLNDSISICKLKRFVAETESRTTENKIKRNGHAGNKKIAVVGSGPSGLTASYYLSKAGYSVNIFEAFSEPGGMARWAIPDFRLPKEILKSDIDKILKTGIELETNTRIKNVFELKKNGYEVIYLAIGAGISKKLDLENRNQEGIFWGLDFLVEINKGKRNSIGRHVVVIGGGNVAVDAALSAVRLGAEEVKIICLESREEMPAFQWEIEEAVEEGIKIENSWGPKKILGNGKVKGIELIRCTSVFDKKGKFNPSFDQSVTKIIETDTIIIAVGQISDFSIVSGINSIKITEHGTIKVNPDTLETDFPGIFAGGDVVKGTSSVVEAIAYGRRAALSIAKYLDGKELFDIAFKEEEKYNPFLGTEISFATKRRIQLPSIPMEKRKRSFELIELGYNEKMAVEEAKRCLRCDLRFQLSPVLMPPEKWIALNYENISQVPETEGVYQLLDDKKNILLIAGTPNLKRALEAQMEKFKKACYFLYEEYPMYTKRESELIQQFLQKHGRLPEGNDELENLF
ncbi:MAG: FAD-dependent oxidoreductase [Acidobacteriota bacterium]